MIYYILRELPSITSIYVFKYHKEYNYMYYNLTIRYQGKSILNKSNK